MCMRLLPLGGKATNRKLSMLSDVATLSTCYGIHFWLCTLSELLSSGFGTLGRTDKQKVFVNDGGPGGIGKQEDKQCR